MSHPILETLPEVHGILLGLGLVFYSAFATHAYQKVHHFQEQIALLHTRLMVHFQVEPLAIQNPALVGNGTIDWDEVVSLYLKNIVADAESMDTENHPTDERIVQNAYDLCEILFWMLTTYPLFGIEAVDDQSLSLKISSKRDAPIDSARVTKIWQRIDQIECLWVKSKELKRMCLEADEIEKRDPTLRRGVESTPGGWPDLPHNTTFEYLVPRYAETILAIKSQLLPELSYASHSLDNFKQHFHLRKLNRQALSLFLFILFFGISLPLWILQHNTDNPLNLIAVNSSAYLCFSILPYLFLVFRIREILGRL